MPVPERKNSAIEVFLIFLRLGLTSFGGPVAHLAFFRAEFVTRRQWLSERSYADLVALCHFLPGPASSQVGMALGLGRAGYAGAAAAWLGFTLPSAVALILVALGMGSAGMGGAAELSPGLLDGLKIAAVAVVAQAVWGMSRTLCPDLPRVSLMGVACCVLLLMPGAMTQLVVLVAAAVLGTWIFRTNMEVVAHERLQMPVSRRAGGIWLLLFFVLLVGLPLLTAIFPLQALQMIEVFYRTGSLVFGGGHVVLPLLEAEVVSRAWVDEDIFLAGYGVVQAVPGPLFTFAAFLGTAMNQLSPAWLGGMIALLAIFLPSFLLIAGVLPFWDTLRRQQHVQGALMGVNAAVTGLLLAALYHPVWTGAIADSADFALALLALIALMFWRLPPWLVVAACAAGGWLMADVSFLQ